MAATPFDASRTATSFLLDIYTDSALRNAPAPSPAPAPLLPGGPCNYTDQALPRCGCRRFWSKSIVAAGAGTQDSAGRGASQAEICMCSHHACFHEDSQSRGGDGSGGGRIASAAGGHTLLPAPEPGQENEKPRSCRNLLEFPTTTTAPGRLIPTGNPRHDETADRPAQNHSMPDTLASWGNMLLSQADRPIDSSALRPIPVQPCVTPSQPPSTARSSEARYLRPFGGQGLQTLSCAPAPNGNNAVAAFKDKRDPSDRVMLPEMAPQPRGVAQDATASKTDGFVGGVDQNAFRQLSDTVHSHEQRLDRLENPSFSIAGHDECQDKLESVDVRVTELESRIDDVEKLLNDNSSATSSRRAFVRAKAGAVADDATASVVSLATDISGGAVPDRGELFSQLRALEAQVSKLQAASLPSYTKPWIVEVVLLPFPLQGVWIAGHGFPTVRASDEWTQMPNTISRATPDPMQRPQAGEWLDQPTNETDWLLAKAFPPGRIIDQRLKSRGLIKTVVVRGPDARSVQLAINSAFQDVLRMSRLGSPAQSSQGFPPLLPHPSRDGDASIMGLHLPVDQRRDEGNRNPSPLYHNTRCICTRSSTSATRLASRVVLADATRDEQSIPRHTA